MTAMLQGAADAHRFATRRSDYRRMHANAEANRTQRVDSILARLETDLADYRHLAHIARAKGERIDGAATEIIAAAADRLEEQ